MVYSQIMLLFFCVNLLSLLEEDHTALFKQGNRLNTRKGLTFYSPKNFSLELHYADPSSLPEGSWYVFVFLIIVN
jgi:hypothetical protein